MPQPPIPPTIEKLRRHPKWSELEPVYARGYDDAKRGTWDNDLPERTLRWHAYELGWDEADEHFNRTNTNEGKPRL